jgi:hypothetical protein
MAAGRCRRDLLASSLSVSAADLLESVKSSGT